jgi:hypothetical protein
MPGTILVREALRRVSVLLMDIDPQFTKHPESELVDFLNDGALSIITYLPTANARVDSLRLRPGVLQGLESVATTHLKQEDGSDPSEAVRGVSLQAVLANMGADGLTPGRAVRLLDRRELDTAEPLWMAATPATAIKGYVYDPLRPLHFEVTPPVHASTQVWARIAWSAQPARLPAGAPGSELYPAGGSGGAVIPLRDEFCEPLVNYIVARAVMKESEWADAEKAAVFGNLFLSWLNAKVKITTGTSPNLKRLPFSPEPIGAAS